MSIRSDFGDFSNLTAVSLDTLFSAGKNALNSILGIGATLGGNLFSGGFTGISEEGLTELKSKITDLITELEDHIKEFNGHQLETAIKGPLLQATEDYFTEVKNYLSRYVEGLKASINDIETARINFNQGASNAAKDVVSDAQDVKAAGENIKLD